MLALALADAALIDEDGMRRDGGPNSAFNGTVVKDGFVCDNAAPAGAGNADVDVDPMAPIADVGVGRSMSGRWIIPPHARR